MATLSLPLALRSYEYWIFQYKRTWRGSVVSTVLLRSEKKSSIDWLMPHKFFGIEFPDQFSHGVFWSLLVNTGKSLFSETFPQLWLFAMGGLFIAVPPVASSRSERPAISSSWAVILSSPRG